MKKLLSGKIIGVLAILFLIGAVLLTVWLSQKQQETRQQAQVTSCPVQFAICKWDSLGGGYTYKVTIVDATTGTIIAQNSIAATQLSFPASSGKTYRCDVSAVNSCGEGPKSSGTGSACPGVVAQAPVASTPTPTPTPTPTLTPTPTPATPTPTPTPVPPTPAPSTPTPTTPTPIAVTPTPPHAQPTLTPTGGNAATNFGAIGVLVTILGALLIIAF